MLSISVTQEFADQHCKLDFIVKRKLQKQESLFLKNPFHPSLHVEKLEPRQRAIWSFRVDKKYRVLFRFLEENHVVLLTIGPHDWVYRV